MKKFKYPKGEEYKIMLESFKVRNAEIMRLYKSGIGFEEIASDKRFGLTRQRVYAIVQKELKKGKKSKPLDKIKK